MKNGKYVTYQDFPNSCVNVFRKDEKGREHFVTAQPTQVDADELCAHMNSCKCYEFEGDNEDCPLHGKKAGQ